MTENLQTLLGELLEAVTWYRVAENKGWKERNEATRNLQIVVAKCEQATNQQNQ